MAAHRAAAPTAKTDGKLYGWGVSNGGTLGGSGINSYVDAPRELPGATGAISMAVAGETKALALKSDGTLAFWPGTASFATDTVTAGQVAGLTGVVKIVHGPGLDQEPIAIKSDGTAWTISWSATVGSGGAVSNTAVVRQITGLPSVSDVACGENHCLALLTDGTVPAWGSNHNGQLGNGTSTGFIASGVIPSGGATAAVIPSAVPGLSGVRAIGADSGASVAVKTDGTV